MFLAQLVSRCRFCSAVVLIAVDLTRGKSNSMDARTKYLRATKNAQMGQRFFSMLVEKHLDSGRAKELATLMDEGMMDIPPEASYEEKYEASYENWIHQGRTGYAFIRKHMGTRGMDIFKEEKVRSLTQQNSGVATYVLNMLSRVMPGVTFKAIVKGVAEELQWITPIQIRELTRSYAIMDVPRCKVRQHGGTEDFCSVGCMKVYPEWVLQQYKLSMKFILRGPGCVCYVSTMSPDKSLEVVPANNAL